MAYDIVTGVICLIVCSWVGFVLADCVSNFNGAMPCATIIHYRPVEDGKMTYVIAGMGGQADEAVGKLIPEITGGITFVNFRGLGYSAEHFCRRIAIDMATLPEGTRCTLVAISVGAQVAQAVSDQIGCVYYAINPCMNWDFLNRRGKRTVFFIGVVSIAMKYLLGWLSYVPFFSVAMRPSIRGYSFATFAGQVAAICCGLRRSPVEDPKLVGGVVISNLDEVLDNRAVEAYFAGCKIVTIDAEHASINRFPDEYRAALHELGLF